MVANRIKSVLRPIYVPLTWGMMTSWPAFNRRRKRYFDGHPIKRRREVDDPILQELFANGIVVLPSYFDSEMISCCHDAALNVADRIRRGDPEREWETLSYINDGIYRLINIDKVLPQTAAILDDQRLLAIARQYLGYPIRDRINYLDYKPDFGKHDATTIPHMDSWLSQIKIFTLLNDVNALSAPMVYWKRSHLDAEWRREADYQNFKGDSFLGSSGICPEGVLRDRCSGKDESLEMITVTGPAGTVAIADVRGFHRASNVFARYRLEVVQKFTIATQ
jgi:hypothetical protein